MFCSHASNQRHRQKSAFVGFAVVCQKGRPMLVGPVVWLKQGALY
jgi:hypothetical protein